MSSYSSSFAHMHAIRGELEDLLDAINDAEAAGVFGKGSVEQMLTDLIKSSALTHYEFATKIIQKDNAQTAISSSN